MSATVVSKTFFSGMVMRNGVLWFIRIVVAYVLSPKNAVVANEGYLVSLLMKF